MPHVDPLDRADLPQFEEKFARYDEIRGFLPNSILTMRAGRISPRRSWNSTRPSFMKHGAGRPEDDGRTHDVHGDRLPLLPGPHGQSEPRLRCAGRKDCRRMGMRDFAALYGGGKSGAGAGPRGCRCSERRDRSSFCGAQAAFQRREVVEIVASIALFGYLNRWNDTMATTMEAHPAAVAKKAMPAWDEGKHGASK